MGYAAARYGHVMFPENVHEPALRAAEVLLGGVGKGVLSFLRTVTFAQLELYATLDVMDLKVHFSFRILKFCLDISRASEPDDHCDLLLI